MTYYLVCELSRGIEIIEINPKKVIEEEFATSFRFDDIEKLKVINKFSNLIIDKSYDKQDMDMVLFILRDIINNDCEWVKDYVFKSKAEAEMCVKNSNIQDIIQ